MKKFITILHWTFYSLLFISLILIIAYFGLEIIKNGLLIGYTFIYIILPLIILSLLFLLLYNFYIFGFIYGIKQSSIKILTLIFCFFIGKHLRSNFEYRNNKMLVEIQNRTSEGIANIKIIGRNAKSEIDTLAPNEKRTVIFRGKKIVRDIENDYENEIELLFYHKNKWREKGIFKGFNRWRHISNDLSIHIYNSDSISVFQIKK
ncbi:hypothetical protein [Christiangramia portivictoriae]|uniref:hypothetical protein n=1 Tax=Christiangramia portivictoriae TaxID=326069 RepID=UPI0003F638C6|nr:hypothetical protein [Christiangramia portivictoriae]